MKNKAILKMATLVLLFTFALTNVAFAGQFANAKIMPAKPKATFVKKAVPVKPQIATTKPKIAPEKATNKKTVYIEKKVVIQKPAVPAKKDLDKITEMKLPIFVNGKAVKFDVPPILKNGRTLIPLRAVMEKFGVQVEYDKATNTVTMKKGNKEVKIVFEGLEGKIYVNGKEVKLDVPALVISNRTYVPLRFLMEVFGKKIYADGTKIDIRDNNTNTTSGSGQATEQNSNNQSAMPESNQSATNQSAGENNQPSEENNVTAPAEENNPEGQ